MGFLWIGTQGDGLYRYDGYTFHLYEPSPGDGTTLPGSNITGIFEDDSGGLWITGWSGVSRYDRSADRFRTWHTDTWTTAVHRDRRGTAWLGTHDGLYRFDSSAARLSRDDSPLGREIGAGRVHAIEESRDGRIWVGTDSGLVSWDPTTREVTRFIPVAADPRSLPGLDVVDILVDSADHLWVATRTAGLARLAPTGIGGFDRYRHDPHNPGSLAHDRLLALEEDAQGALWIGTENRGLDRFDPLTATFSHSVFDPDDSRSLGHPSVWALHQDVGGDLWVGTFAGGLNVLRKTPPAVELFQSRAGDPRTLKSNVVKVFLEGSDGALYVGTDGGGLHLFDPRSQSFQRFHTGNSAIPSDAVLSLHEDVSGYVWVGTWAGGLVRFDPDSRTFDRHFAHDEGLPSANIFGITETPDGSLWVLDFGAGLLRIDPDHGINRLWSGPELGLADNYNLALARGWNGRLIIASQSSGISLFDPADESHEVIRAGPQGLSNDNVQSVHVTGSGIWIGTESGLNRIDRDGRITHFFREQGLPGNQVTGVLEDRSATLWVATNHGLCRYRPEAESCDLLTRADNLQGNHFNPFASLVVSDGTLLFGGSNGFNRIHPDRVGLNTKPPRIVLTDFQLFNRSVAPGVEGSVLDAHISVTPSVTLTHDQNLLTVEYAALDFVNPAKNRYAYRLDGFDEDWHDVGTRRTATYSNLDPGDYELLIRGSNNDGVWSHDPARLSITVLPPFWQTWWFRLMLWLAGLAMLAALLMGARHMGQVEGIREQLRLEEELREKAQAANLAKDQFLANMSHEIRTPMNGVMGMIELTLDSSLTPAQREYLGMAAASAESLLTIINDILDFSKIEAGMLGMESIPFDIRKRISTTSKSLAFRAQAKGLEFAIEVEPDVPEVVTGDPTRLAQVLVNLVGNAIKFTESGEISVTVSLVEGSDPEDAVDVQFSVRDTGIGIPLAQQAQIFEAFVQADMSTTRHFGGTGLGLVISSRLVELMDGRIWVESEPGQGSAFHFTARFQTEHDSVRDLSLASPPALEGLHVLVVDDNDTNRFILERMLQNWNMKPRLVSSGQEALEAILTAEDKAPYPLVLLDYQMPGMDGLEVARRIRERWTAGEVALVMLTSMTEIHMAEEIAALDVAVHVIKPFTQSEVLDGILSVTRGGAAWTPEEAADAQERKTGPLRVLLAEDNPVNRTLAVRILESAGHSVEVAHDGQLAVEAFRQGSFDLILMDMQMPVMDGYEATRLIRQIEAERGGRIPIVALTARALAGDEQRCLDAGMDAYLSKPVRMAQLERTIAEMAGRPA